MAFNQPIALVGLKHVGKSTVGRALSRYAHCPFYDVDHEMIARARSEGWFAPSGDPAVPTIRQLYQFLGRESFLTWEAATLRAVIGQLTDMKVDRSGARTDAPAAGTTHGVASASADRQRGRLRAVIATGGGICDNPSAVEALQSACTTVYLEDSPEVLYQRIEARGVPAFLDPARPREHFLEMAARRDERYRAFADYTIPIGGRTADEIASTVEKTVR